MMFDKKNGKSLVMNLFFLIFADERRILFHRCISYQEMHLFYVTLFFSVLYS